MAYITSYLMAEFYLQSIDRSRTEVQVRRSTVRPLASPTAPSLNVIQGGLSSSITVSTTWIYLTIFSQSPV